MITNSDSPLKSYPYRLPLSLILFANIFLGGGLGFIAYVFSIEQLGVTQTIVIESLILIVLAFVIKEQMKFRYIRIFKEKIELPDGRKIKTLSFGDIASVEETQKQGFCLIVTDKAGKIYIIEQQRLELGDYFEILDSLIRFMPKEIELTPKQKKLKKFILIGTIASLTVSAFIVGINTNYQGQVFRTLAGFAFMSVFLTGMTILINNIQKYQKENRKTYLDPSIKKRRSILSSIILVFFIIALGSVFYFMAPQNRLDANFNLLYLVFSLPILLCIIVDKTLEAKEFSSKSERILYYGCFLIFGAMNLMFSGPHIIKNIYSQNITDKEATLTSHYGKRNQFCFTFKLDSIMEPEICTGKYPCAKEGVKVKYSEYRNSSGITVFGNFQVTNDCIAKKDNSNCEETEKK